MDSKNSLIVCDFDGTAVTKDLGSKIQRTFGDAAAFQSALDAFYAGNLPLHELQRQSWATVSINQAKLDDFLAATARWRPGFADFVEFCNRQQLDLRIVSGGFNLYIEPLLQQAGFDLPVVANQARIVGEKAAVCFPNYASGCGFCSNCKGSYIKEAKAQHRGPEPLFVIGIGDGWSDRCMAKEADLVFACGGLVDYCAENRLACRPFDHFDEIRQHLAI